MNGVKLKLISADIGSGYTQATDGKNTTNLKSVVSRQPARDELAFGSEDAEVVGFNGVAYLVGDHAVAFGDLNTREDTLCNDWGGSTGWMVLLCAALGRLGVKSGDNVVLVTGLPQAIYSKRQSDLKRLLNSKLSFTYQGIFCEITIKPMIIPQASGALFYQISQDSGLASAELGIVDIGTYTTGLSAKADSGEINKNKCGGVPVGVSQLAQAVQSKLRLEFGGWDMDITKIPKLLMERTMLYRRNTIDIGDMIDQQALLVANPMLDEIKRLWLGGADMYVYLAGGGSPFFFDAVKSVVPHAEIMGDCFNSVCKGMFLFAEDRLSALEQARQAKAS